MPLLIASLAALSAGFAVFGALRARVPEPSRRRIEQLQDAGVEPDPGEASFRQRVVFPAVHQLASVARVLLPVTFAAKAEALVERAGGGVAANTFLAVWLGVSAAFLGGGVLWLFGSSEGPSSVELGLVSGFVAVGSYLPWMWLRRRAAERTRAIDRQLPQAVDMIVTNVEAGLGLQAAMLLIAKKLNGPIAVEFARVMREIGVGRPREEALLAMARRTGSPDMGLVARAIAQAERSGLTVGTVLRSQAQEIRSRRRDRAREQANKIPVKMTVPTILFIFPTLFLLVLGPVALNAFEMLAE